VPVTAADAVVQALAESDPELPGFTGPEAVVGALVAASGRVVVEETRLRLFILGELIPPTGVRGSPRLLAEDDLGLVGSWIEEFVRHTRMGFGGRTGAEVAAQWLQIGAGAVVWVVDGEPVSLARFGPPAAGVSRVGSVFTPEDRRGHGYGAAATAAVSRLAWDAGADDVVLFTDLANPVSNRLYRRLGYAPVADHRQVRLAASKQGRTT